MTWNLGKKDSRCASISVRREQEDWGEYGIHTAHKHKYLFKIIHKRHLKVPKKRSTYHPKPCPRPHLEPKNHSDAAKVRKKTLLSGRGFHRARQMDPKVNLQTGPRASKSKIYVLCQKNMICGISLEATETLLGG